jgi:2-polyprenyl-3-methyl-5-hydroxy-6-metoxy-1,4-benzoquinol methylase
MIKLITNHPIAFESADHQFPIGSSNDNNTNSSYINEVRSFFKSDNLCIMDLGCAGGQIIVDHLEHGDLAVGLEGSDTALSGKGAHNWQKLLNKNLFLCDITEDFQILDESNEIIKFDMIQMWDVLEHIPENKMSVLMSNIKKHLKVGGYFMGQISQQIDPVHHISVFTFEKWKEIFEQNGLTLGDYIFQHTPRPRLSLNAVDSNGFIQSGFPFTAQANKV